MKAKFTFCVCMCVCTVHAGSFPKHTPTLEHITETLEMGKRQDSLKVGICCMIFGVIMKMRGHASVRVVHTVSHQTPEEH